MIEDNSNRLLMSDSIKGIIPDLEEENLKQFQDSFIISYMLFEYDGSSYEISGSISGISFEDKSLSKVDIKVSISSAYGLMSRYSSLNNS